MEDSIPWPDENKGLFVQGGGYHEFAHFGWGGIWQQFHAYSTGYKESADLILGAALQSKDISRLDTVVFPAFFLYRQFIELSLKQSILEFGRHSREEKLSVLGRLNHDLKNTWDEFLTVLPEPRDEDEASTRAIVEAYVLEFARMDKSSLSFRYPITKNLVLMFGEEQRINLRHVMERMAELQSFFNGVSDYMDAMKAVEADMNAEFADGFY